VHDWELQWSFGDRFDCAINFMHEFNAKAHSPLFVPQRSFIEFVSRLVPKDCVQHYSLRR
jgi:hypothetical protein